MKIFESSRPEFLFFTRLRRRPDLRSRRAPNPRSPVRWLERVRERGPDDAHRALHGALVVLALLSTGRSAPAHHSFAGYERELQIQLDGTVAGYQWTNPHVYIELEASADNGELARWVIECANPGILNRVGWKWNMIQEGDEISVIVSPLQNGDAGALLKSVRLADGSIYSNGGPAGPATIAFDD